MNRRPALLTGKKSRTLLVRKREGESYLPPSFYIAVRSKKARSAVVAGAAGHPTCTLGPAAPGQSEGGRVKSRRSSSPQTRALPSSEIAEIGERFFETRKGGEECQ
jgi:hypothetical protein